VAYEALLDGDFKSLEINLEKGLIELILKRMRVLPHLIRQNFKFMTIREG
jgi:hypothetical protein